MSVFGGDSWGREAQYRKRRIDDVVIQGIDGSSYKKLSTGKYACLICPHNPILDTPLMLSMHCKGSRHRTADSKLKEKELMRRNEVNKRIALSASDTPTTSAINSSTGRQYVHLGSKPLIQMSQKAAAEILGDKTSNHNSSNKNHGMVLTQYVVENAKPDSCLNHPCPTNETTDKLPTHQLDFQNRREQELKFTSAGWKRDCHGKWYKDENVEFDSDEEDPNNLLD